MRQSEIDKRIKELTQEANELAEQRGALKKLQRCKDQGHDPVLAEIEHDFIEMEGIVITCTRCGATATSTDKMWRLSGMGFEEGPTVDDVYEIEFTEPLPQPAIVREAESTPPPDSPVDTGDKDTKGFYRVTLGGDDK
jgi:hypothetical protein